MSWDVMTMKFPEGFEGNFDDMSDEWEPEELFTHNVPVVCDVLTAAIRELRSNSSGGQNVPEKNLTLVLW